MKEALGTFRDLSVRYGFTLLEMKVFMSLSVGGVTTYDEVRASIGDPATTPEFMNLLRVIVHRVRKKIASDGFRIASIHGVGYHMKKIGEMPTKHDPIKILCYVPFQLVDAYMALGWEWDGTLTKDHHSAYSVIMEWKGEGEMREPDKAKFKEPLCA